MLLDLFITHWNEPWDVGEKGLQMLRLQRGIDWSQVRVTIVHDGSEPFPEENFSGYHFTVRQVSIPHGGIAAARNWCIDHADAEWIKWNDFDDMFYGIHAMRDIVNALEHAEAYDLLWFDMFLDDEIRDRYSIKNERDPVFVHNKCFRTSFLRDACIRFNEELVWCEDSAFLAVIEMDIDHQRIGKITCAAPPYVYIARDGSLCNRKEIRFANLQSFFKRHCYVADEFQKRGMTDEFNTMCMRVICDSYYTLCRAPDIEEDKSEHEKRVWEWYDSHKEFINRCRPEMFILVLKAVNRECFDGGVITGEQVMDWISAHERGEDEWPQQKQAI